MNSLSVFEFKHAIQNFVNDSPIPDEVKRMVLEDIEREQEKKTIEAIKREIEERDRKGAEKDAESV